MRILAAEVLSYLPAESFFVLAASADVFVAADDIQFSTHSRLNRASIKTATGAPALTIPILTKGRAGQKLHEVEIDPAHDWPRRHWRTIEFNYHNAPYFGELADELEVLYRRPYQKLSEVAWEFLKFFWKILRWEKLPPRTSEFHLASRGAQRVAELARAVNAGIYLAAEKYRGALPPALMPELRLRFMNLDLPPYHQQFEGFIGGLTILDLLFNEGTAFTRERLRNLAAKVRNDFLSNL